MHCILQTIPGCGVLRAGPGGLNAALFFIGGGFLKANNKKINLSYYGTTLYKGIDELILSTIILKLLGLVVLYARGGF